MNEWSSRPYGWGDRFLPVLPVILGILAYAFVHVNYNIYYVDDAWVLSNVWNISRLGVACDLVFIDAGTAGHVQYFGITYAMVVGQLLDWLGWTKSNAFLISSFFVWMTVGVWYFILRQLPFSKKVRQLTVLFMPLFPPFFFAAHCARPEAFVGFVLSLQLLLFIRKRYFWAALLTGFAFEAHIMGLVGLFFLLAYAIYHKEELIAKSGGFWRIFLPFSLGGLTALGYYFWLHGAHFSWVDLATLIGEKRDMGTPLNNYILSYFINYDWYSRIWEFVLFLVALGLYFRKGLSKRNRFLTILVIVVLVSTLITRRENRNYMVHIFPAFILLYFYTFEQLGQLRKFVGVLTLCMSLYYGLHFYYNSSYNFEKIIAEIREAIGDTTLPVVGVPDFWFAAMEQPFVPIHRLKEANFQSLDQLFLIQSDYLEWRCREYDRTMKYYQSNYSTSLVKEFTAYRDKTICIWRCDRKATIISER